MSEDDAIWQVVQSGDEIMNVLAYAGTSQTQGRAFVLLLDIQDIFPYAESLQHGSRAIHFMTDPQGHRIYPLRVHHQPEIVMEVAQATTATQYQSRFVSRPIVITQPEYGIRSRQRGSPQLYPHQLEQQEAYLYQCKEELESQPQLLPTAASCSHHQQEEQQQFQDSYQQESQLLERQYSFLQQSRRSSRRRPKKAPQSPQATDEIVRAKYRKSVFLYESFLQHIQAGQIEEANAFRDDFRDHFGGLEIAMAQNKALQEQMLGMQQTMVDMQQQSLDQLAVIQSRVQAILVQNYELHEYPIPRLFIVLPYEQRSSSSASSPTVTTATTATTVTSTSLTSLSSNSSSSRWDSPASSLFQKRFRLYFLCECGEHTRSGHNTTMQHHIHLSPHEGYDIDCPDEFFQCYGSYVLRLLQMLKYGVAVAGLAVLAMTPRRNSVYSIDSRSTSSHNTLEQRINQAIAHLEEWSADQRSRRRWRNNNEGENMLDSQDQGEALERADLTRLSSFLRERDEVLGNLYRIITNEGYVKWVCSEHYHEICNVSAAQEIGDLATIHGGSFDEHLGRIEISLPSAAAATQLYKVMDRAKATQELKLTLQWEANITDVKSLRDAVHRSNVVSVDLKFMASKSTGSILNRHKRADPLWQMIMGAKVQSFTLSGYSGFFRRSAIELQTTDLRVLKLSEAVDWKKDGSKVIDLIRKSPRLCELVLSCTDVNESYESIRRAAAGSCQLNSLSITAGKEDSLRVTFDQDRSHAVRTMQVVVPKLVPEENSLLRASSCITSLHICARSAVYRECSVILELLSRNPRLSELKVGCYVAEFSSVFEHLRKHLASDPSSQLRQVSLYRDDNRLVSTDLSDPTASSLSLELMSLNVNERVLTKLLRAYGASLTKLTIDSPHWKPIHSCALEEATRLHPKVHLQRLTHLYQRCADVDDAILDKLNIVINRSRQSLVEYELVIDKLFKTDPQSSRRWVGFIRVVGERLTKFVMSCSDPSEWIHALGDVDFPAMERISFKHESKVELVNAKRVFSAIVGIGYVARNSNDDGDQDDRTHGRDRLLTHDAIIGVGGW